MLQPRQSIKLLAVCGEEISANSRPPTGPCDEFDSISLRSCLGESKVAINAFPLHVEVLDLLDAHVSARGASHHGRLEHPRHERAFICCLLDGVVGHVGRKLLSVSASRLALAGALDHISVRHTTINDERRNNVATPSHDLNDDMSIDVAVILSISWWRRSRREHDNQPILDSVSRWANEGVPRCLKRFLAAVRVSEPAFSSSQATRTAPSVPLSHIDEHGVAVPFSDSVLSVEIAPIPT